MIDKNTERKGQQDLCLCLQPHWVKRKNELLRKHAEIFRCIVLPKHWLRKLKNPIHEQKHFLLLGSFKQWALSRYGTLWWISGTLSAWLGSSQPRFLCVNQGAGKPLAHTWKQRWVEKYVKRCFWNPEFQGNQSTEHATRAKQRHWSCLHYWPAPSCLTLEYCHQNGPNLSSP